MTRFRWHMLVGVAALAAFTTGCSKTIFTTERTLHVNQTANLWHDASFKYVRTGLMASAAAEPGSPESKALGRTAMNLLVAQAKLGPNQALVDVTLEEGLAVKGSDAREVITLRGDVIEFMPRSKGK